MTPGVARPEAVRALLARSPVRRGGVWIVGGAVRDALLEIVPRELDLVVEGDAVALARELGEVTAVHGRFGTATVRLAEGAVIDVAAARTETYARPGALPAVRLGATIEQDLRRRDFTVNAMAVHTLDGRLVAVRGADADLRAGVLRVLHPRSFSDDPTRMLRMARYAARLRFRPAQAPDPALLATVSGERCGAELRLALDEPLPDVLVLLGEWGLGEALFGPGGVFEADPALLRRACGLWPGGLTALGAALRGDVRAALDRLAFRARERDVLAAAAAAAPLRGRDWRRLRRLAPEVVAVAGARGDADAARWWLEDGRHIRPAVGGEDLLAAGLRGRAVGAGLERALAIALAGGGRDAQLAAALGDDR